MSNMDKLKQLRAETGVSYAMCKNALDESKGDMDKARDILRQKGAEVAQKKSDRATDQGNVFSYIHHNKRIGSMVVLLCETDFVAKNETFQELGNGLAMQIASFAPESVEALKESPYIKDSSSTVDQLMKDVILKLGENITIGEFVRYEI